MRKARPRCANTRLSAAPSSIVPPADEKHDAPKETVLGEKPEEGVPVSTSGPVSESKIQSALSETPAPKTDPSEDDAHKIAADKELKEKSPVGGSEVEAVEGKGEKPPVTKTVEEAMGEKEEEKKEASGEGSEEKEETEEKEEPEANGPADEEKEEEEESKEAGDKRSAAAVTNGGAAEEPAGKKAKKTEGAPTTNGGTGRRGSKAKNKREPAPVGKTARRTRSQGLTES